MAIKNPALRMITLNEWLKYQTENSLTQECKGEKCCPILTKKGEKAYQAFLNKKLPAGLPVLSQQDWVQYQTDIAYHQSEDICGQEISAKGIAAWKAYMKGKNIPEGLSESAWASFQTKEGLSFEDWAPGIGGKSTWTELTDKGKVAYKDYKDRSKSPGDICIEYENHTRDIKILDFESWKKAQAPAQRTESNYQAYQQEMRALFEAWLRKPDTDKAYFVETAQKKRCPTHLGIWAYNEESLKP